MIKFAKLLSSLVVFAAIVPAAHPAQASPADSKVPVTTVVSVLGPDYSAPPALGKSDVVVYTGKTREDVTQWDPAQGEKAALQLAILIDDGTHLGPQLNDLRNFVQTQPKDTAIGVFYSMNGSLLPETVRFTTDHDAAGKQVRLTTGTTGISTSMYLALMELMSKWPATTARREILVIGDGIDRYRGDPDSPDVQSTITKAQKAGIIIHTLFARVADAESRNMIRVTYGQANLGQMAYETGGEAFFQGLDTPVAFAPFLDKLDMVLHNQYLLTFTTDRGTRRSAEFRKLRINTEQKNVYISAPDGVWVSGAAK